MTDDNLNILALAISGAKEGNETAVGFLRGVLRRMADSMPVDLLISVSQLILDRRTAELCEEAESN